jgi:hypothetical protein
MGNKAPAPGQSKKPAGKSLMEKRAVKKAKKSGRGKAGTS